MSKGRASRAQEAETGVSLWVKGQSSLYSKFLASQGHIVIPCLKLLPTKWENWFAKAVLTFVCIHSCTCVRTHQPPPTHTDKRYLRWLRWAIPELGSCRIGTSRLALAPHTVEGHPGQYNIFNKPKIPPPPLSQHNPLHKQNPDSYIFISIKEILW